MHGPYFVFETSPRCGFNDEDLYVWDRAEDAGRIEGRAVAHNEPSFVAVATGEVFVGKYKTGVALTSHSEREARWGE